MASASTSENLTDGLILFAVDLSVQVVMLQCCCVRIMVCMSPEILVLWSPDRCRSSVIGGKQGKGATVAKKGKAKK